MFSHGRMLILALVVVLGVAGAVLWIVRGTDAPVATMPADLDIAQGEQLYRDFCAACHGANLEGQPDWRSAGPDGLLDGLLPAPPHDETGHTWHHPDSVLFDYTKLGGKAALASQGIDFESGMPGFSTQLSDADIWNVFAYIKSTWPESERSVQAERSASAEK